MFYVHLFLKAMYRGKKKQLFFFCISKHLHTSVNIEAESRLHHEGNAQKQRRSEPNTATGSESTEAVLTGRALVNTRTTAAS